VENLIMTTAQHDTERNWQACLADMVFACAVATPQQAGTLINAVSELLQAAPSGWHAQFRDAPSAAVLAPLIAAGGEVAAVMALIEGRGSYMLSHGPGGTHLATVVFEECGEEASAEGRSAALALLGALAGSLAGSALNLPAEHGTDLAISSLRLN
jgi:hypothetical protein